ncbi:MAG: lysylphosphatidylglycerol synthase transmembrane domain-containing protein [Magnetovibrio sp.]|nr:lysylphosphatidylglycerol synthase transmembrane domain-containing protein [Magnetovibrio sp.]
MKKWLALALKIAVSGALIWYLVGTIDIDAAKARLAQVDPLMLAAAAALLLLQMMIAGFRWRAVLRAIGVELPYWEVVRLFYIGVFFNQALPGGTGGDAVRIYMVYKSDVGLRGAFNGVILERVAIVLALVLLVVAAQPFIVPKLDEAAAAWVVPVVVLVTLGACAGLGLVCALDRLPKGLRRWRLVRGLGHLAGDARAVFLKPANALPALLWGVAGHVNFSLSVFVLAVGLDIAISPMDTLVLIPPVLLVMTIPISIGAWGVRENAMVVSLGLVGVAPEAATVLGLLVGLVGLCVAIPGGLIWLVQRRRHGVSLAQAESELAAVGDAEKP